MKDLEYKQPRCKVIEIQCTQLLCQSNDSMTETDLGDGGFSQDND